MKNRNNPPFMFNDLHTKTSNPVHFVCITMCLVIHTKWQKLWFSQVIIDE